MSEHSHTLTAPQPAAPPLLPLRVYSRRPCGVLRYYFADAPAEKLIKRLLKFPTLSEEKRADLEKLGVKFEDVSDPRLPCRAL